MVRKLLYALRSGLFDAAIAPVVVGTYYLARKLGLCADPNDL